jgi:hypothetical protein
MTQQVSVGIVDDANNQCVDDFGLAVVMTMTVAVLAPPGTPRIFNPGQEWQAYTDFPGRAWR